MIVGFVDYMILNGVDASNITLLTFYNGQRKRMNREIHNHQNAHAFIGIKVVTVDGYQGTSPYISRLIGSYLFANVSL
jgi:helicase required for RNAi-mediated heterochromatin assembly 1